MTEHNPDIVTGPDGTSWNLQPPTIDGIFVTERAGRRQLRQSALFLPNREHVTTIRQGELDHDPQDLDFKRFGREIDWHGLWGAQLHIRAHERVFDGVKGPETISRLRPSITGLPLVVIANIEHEELLEVNRLKVIGDEEEAGLVLYRYRGALPEPLFVVEYVVPGGFLLHDNERAIPS